MGGFTDMKRREGDTHARHHVMHRHHDVCVIDRREGRRCMSGGFLPQSTHRLMTVMHHSPGRRLISSASDVGGQCSQPRDDVM